MTRTTLRKAPFQDFRKPAFAALMLSATMLAGCATNRTPQFSYDADVPSSPVVPAAVTDDRPRPLHTPPAWTVIMRGNRPWPRWPKSLIRVTVAHWPRSKSTQLSGVLWSEVQIPFPCRPAS